MPAKPTAKVPPAFVVRAVEGARARVQRLHQLMAPAPLALLEMILGSMITQTIYAAASLGIADVLLEGPMTADEIATKIDADPGGIYRLLRLLASYSIFAELGDGRFKLTPMAAALCSDAPYSMRGIALLMGHPTHWEDWGQLAASVRTGEASMPKLRGMGCFDYLEANPDYMAVFANGMGCLSDLETAPILAAYDFSRFGTIVDVGAGRGALLTAILSKARNSRGIFFDSPRGAAELGPVLAEAGLNGRSSIESGSVFDRIPRGGDAYILKHIVHDWPESKSLEILKNVRDAMPDNGTLLLMEFVLTERNSRDIGKLVDLWLMLLVDGMERTSEQYADLLASAGFRLSRVVQTASPVAIIEAKPD